MAVRSVSVSRYWLHLWENGGSSITNGNQAETEMADSFRLSWRFFLAIAAIHSPDAVC
jgi:hypothetical protein